jgi:hypothetical protein
MKWFEATPRIRRSVRQVWSRLEDLDKGRAGE